MIDVALRDELVAMAAEDQRVRSELAADGSLYQGYHPRMEAVHLANSTRLQDIISARGWPGRTLAGEEGSRSAWLILQHAISSPDLQRRGLALLRLAAVTGEVPPAEVAMLEDRILVFEGKPQRYGTQFDWDVDGHMSPYPIEDEESVDERRRSVGLEPLAERIRRIREEIAANGGAAPPDVAERRRQMDEWSRSVGWRD